MTCNLSICGKEPFRLSRDSKLCLTGWVLLPIELLGHMSVAGHILEWELTSCGVIWILFGKARIYVTFWDNNKLLLKIKILCVFYTILFYTTSETSARIPSSFQTRENISTHEAAGRVVLLFSSVWKPDETRSTSFWNDFSKETIQNYAVLYFSHFSLKCLVCVICRFQSAFIAFVTFCF